jgi:hypothetical protein
MLSLASETAASRALLHHLEKGSTGRIVVGEGLSSLTVYVQSGQLMAAELGDDARAYLRRLVAEAAIADARAAELLAQAMAGASIFGQLLDEVDPVVIDAVLGDRFRDNLSRFVSSIEYPRFEALEGVFVDNLQVVDAAVTVRACQAVADRAASLRESVQLRAGPRAPLGGFERAVAAALTSARWSDELLSSLPIEPIAGRALLARYVDDGLVERVPLDDLGDTDDETEAYEAFAVVSAMSAGPAADVDPVTEEEPSRRDDEGVVQWVAHDPSAAAVDTAAAPVRASVIEEGPLVELGDDDLAPLTDEVLFDEVEAEVALAARSFSDAADLSVDDIERVTVVSDAADIAELPDLMIEALDDAPALPAAAEAVLAADAGVGEFASEDAIRAVVAAAALEDGAEFSVSSEFAPPEPTSFAGDADLADDAPSVEAAGVARDVATEEVSASGPARSVSGEVTFDMPSGELAAVGAGDLSSLSAWMSHGVQIDEELAMFDDHEGTRGGGKGSFSTDAHNLDRVEVMRFGEDSAPSADPEAIAVDGLPQAKFGAPTLSDEEIEAKIVVANEVIDTIGATFDAEQGAGAGRAVFQILLDGCPGRFAPLLKGLQATEAGRLPIRQVIRHLNARPVSEHRALLHDGLVDLIERYLSIAADELSDSAVDAMLEQTAGYRHRIGL